jgi:hypothetical protein
MRCRSPVSRLNSVLLPLFGFPTTAMLACGDLRTGICAAGILVSLELATRCDGRHGEMPSLFPAQRDAASEQPELQWITAKGGARKHDLGALNESQGHQSLYLGIARVDGLDDGLLALF